MVDTTDEWIQSRTGIKERRILKGEGLATSDLGAEAVKLLCKKRGISPEEIELLICSTASPDMMFPATANIISDKGGAKNAFSFDIIEACSGFIYAFTTGSTYIVSRPDNKYANVGAVKIPSILYSTARAP